MDARVVRRKRTPVISTPFTPTCPTFTAEPIVTVPVLSDRTPTVDGVGELLPELTACSHPSAVRDVWVQALRSGIYRQGIGSLRQQGKRFDALGVLCDLAHQAGLGEWILRGEDEWRYEVPGGTYAYEASLPPLLALWAGLGSETGQLTVPLETAYGTPVTNLLDASDFPDFDFNTIADLICEDRILLRHQKGTT